MPEGSSEESEKNQGKGSSFIEKTMSYLQGQDGPVSDQDNIIPSEKVPSFFGFLREQWSKNKKVTKTAESDQTEPEVQEPVSESFYRRFLSLYNEYKTVQHQQSERLNIYTKIANASALNSEFVVLLIGSCMIATFGLLQGSTAVIIGAMLIAPLMMPILGFSLGVVWGDRDLLWRSLLTLSVGILFAMLFSAGISSLVPGFSLNAEIEARLHPNFLDILIAIASGLVGSYAFVNPNIAGSVSGVAIAVALMPPLCSAGIALGQGSWMGFGGAFLLFLINFIGISMASSFVFWRLEVHPVTHDQSDVENRALKNVVLSVFFLTLIGTPLSYFTYQTYLQKKFETKVKAVIRDLNTGGTMLDLSVRRDGETYFVEPVIIVPPDYGVELDKQIKDAIAEIFPGNNAQVRLVPLAASIPIEPALQAPLSIEPNAEQEQTTDLP